jgi:type IV pilus assembly protein PilB
MSAVTEIKITKEILQLITPEQAWHYHIAPKSRTNGILELYVDDRFDAAMKNELEILLNHDIKAEKIDADTLNKTIGIYYRKNNNISKKIEVTQATSDDFVTKLIQEAKELGSSDIHIEIYDEKARVRIRIDGLLVERYKLNKNEYPALINKIKIKANLDIAEKRLPQDGRIYFENAGKKLDIRVSILPTLHGEKIVLRLLSNDSTNIDLKQLGFTQDELDAYLEGIKKPNGIVLISGPTGSGKTTTLYGTLKLLNEEKRNVLTVEDPIEYTLDGINQVQLKETIGLTFAAALRTFLRQDPDVIMLGEIRDGETAQMAIRAALTGHLVLSTIHTNSAWGTISRLTDMGVPSFLLANTLNTSVAQRLIRKLCVDCKVNEPVNEKIYPRKYKAPRKVETHYVAVGCPNCHYTGYKGRKALYEVIPIDAELADNIKSGNYKVDDLLKERNIKTLAENAFECFEAGITTMEEVYSLLLNF